MKKPLIAALQGERQATPPIWLMRQAGRYLPEYREVRASAGSFLDLCFTPELAAEVTVQPIRRFGLDAAIIFSDILVIPHALGQPVAYEEGRGPVLEAIDGRDGLAMLDRSRVSEILSPTYEAIRRVAAALPERCALIGFAGAPWTVATYMVEGGSSRDFIRTKQFAYGDSDGFQTLVDILVAETVAHLIAQIDAGAEIVQIFDSWAAALPSDELIRWSLAPIERIAAEVKQARPTVPVIAFPRGVGTGYERFAASPAIDAVSIDTGMSPDWARTTLQPLAAVQGNLDPVTLVVGGDALDRQTDAILSALSSGPFVFNLGHGILPMTPVEHVAKLVARVRADDGPSK